MQRGPCLVASGGMSIRGGSLGRRTAKPSVDWKDRGDVIIRLLMIFPMIRNIMMEINRGDCGDKYLHMSNQT